MESAEDREAWCAAARRVAKSRTWLGDWTATVGLSPLLGNLCTPILWLKSIKSLDGRLWHLQCPMNSEESQIPPPWDRAPLPARIHRLLCLWTSGEETCQFCKRYLLSFFVRQGGEATYSLLQCLGGKQVKIRPLKEPSEVNSQRTLEHFSEGLRVEGTKHLSRFFFALSPHLQPSNGLSLCSISFSLSSSSLPFS